MIACDKRISFFILWGDQTRILTLGSKACLGSLLAIFAVCAKQASAQDQAVFAGQIDFSWQQFSIPSVGSGTLPMGEKSVTASGPTTGFSAGVRLSPDPDAFSLMWTGSYFDLSGHSSSTNAISSNPFIITVGSPGSGEIDLSTITDTSGASALANVNFTDSTGATTAISSSASSPAGPNSVTQYAVSPTAAGAAFAALVTDGRGPSAASYGAFADGQGLIFAGVGDFGASTVRTWSFVHATGYTQTVWLAKPLAPDRDFTLKAGLTYRRSRESYGNGMAFDLASSVSGTSIPTVSLSEAGKFNVEAGGPVVGFDARFHPPAPFMIGVSGTAGMAFFGARSRLTHTVVLPQVAAIEDTASVRRDSGVMGLTGMEVSLIFPLEERVELRVSGSVQSTFGAPRPTAGDIKRYNISQYGVGVSLAARF